MPSEQLTYLELKMLLRVLKEVRLPDDAKRAIAGEVRTLAWGSPPEEVEASRELLRKLGYDNLPPRSE